MEFACRGRPAADQDGDGDGRRRSPGPPLPHDAGDTMLVIRDALLLQLQKDRLRQEIIMSELAKLERAMALSSAVRHGIDTAYVERPKPLLFTFNEEFMTWPEHCSDMDEVHDSKKKDVKHGSVQLKSGKPATEDGFSVCSRPCCSNGKAEENEVFDEQKLQESNEPKKMLPSLKWELTGITIPVKKPKLPQSWSCAICQVEAPNTKHNIQEHCAGKRHRSNVASLESTNNAKAETTAESSSCAGQKTSSIKWSCSTCQANGTSEADLKEHLSGRTHQQNIEAQFQEGDGVAKKAEPQEAKCQKSNVPQHSEKPPCSICQDNCNRESELGTLLLAKIQALLDAVNNMAINSDSHEAKPPPNNDPQDAEQTPQSNCSICQTGSEYQSCSSEPQSPRSGGAEPNPGATPVWKRLTVTNTESLRQDVKENAMASSGSQEPHSFPHRKGPDAAKKTFYCKVCDLQCNSEKMLADHLGGRKHREKLEENPFYCKVCGVLCNSLKSLADHLGGRRHRETLEGSDSDSD